LRLEQDSNNESSDRGAGPETAGEALEFKAKQLKMRIRNIGMAFVVVFALLDAAPAVAIDPEVREVLMDREHFEYSGMAKLFAKGAALTPQLIKALDDPAETVSSNARRLLRIVGDEHGVSALHEWCEGSQPRKCFSGPSAPIQPWDYEFIERNIFGRPEAQNNGFLVVNYLLALWVDGSPRAQDAVKELASVVPKDDPASPSFLVASYAKKQPAALSCMSGTPEEVTRRNAFYVPPQDLKNTTVSLLAYDDTKSKALLTVTQAQDYVFLVVLARVDRCWRFQSITLESTGS
jgi:hypothetical protein